jgi:deoxyribonuclease (pyrimidine dimer)
MVDRLTRINTIPPALLTDAHLFAEWRELPRVFPLARKAQERSEAMGATMDLPETYRLGTGHVRFFYDKLGWLARRHRALTQELTGRGYNLTVREPLTGAGDWEPTAEAHRLNVARLRERLRENLAAHRYGGEAVGIGFYDGLEDGA